MRIKITSDDQWLSTRDTIFLGFFEGEAKLQLSQSQNADADYLRESFKSFNFTGKKDQSHVLRLPGKLNAIVSGFGERGKFTLNSLREKVAEAVKTGNRVGAREISFKVKISEDFSEQDTARAISEAVVMAQYKFESNKTEKSENTVENIVISEISIENKKQIEKAVVGGQVFGELNVKAREIVNTIPQIATPEYMADLARKIAKESGLFVTVIGKKDMEKIGMNGILAVGSGSKNEPKLVIMEYNTGSEKTIALVGKGVCFDSGGYDIKGAPHMETMKMDKAGATAVMVTMEAMAKLKPNVNVVGVMPFVENLVSDTSYKPGDIIKTMPGKTIEILNTDAEGRVILSDALHYAVTKYNPEAVIDVATLTGAVIIALGNDVAGIMGNDKPLISRLIVAGAKTYERLWELPMFEDYNELMKSDFADIKNVISNNPGNPAGAITGAIFLQNFIGETKWAHLDIAGTAWSNDEKSYISKGATGFGVRLLTQFLMDYE